ncbi:hypothetical protein GGR50DRAFT_674668 [Xylaria sp. CBS 124048]|nr:hypothetical protein GGR50DRAFT_674668 [Xylaria sp. CBS 124048]
MTVSPASQCCRIVIASRHLRSNNDGIWVSDSLLASAFERFAAVSKTFARRGSFVPGPMEHKKRLAKRQMGELHFGQSHASAPIWELASLVDLTQWKWQPPTPPDLTKRRATDIRCPPDPVLDLSGIISPPQDCSPTDRSKPDKPQLPENAVLNSVADSLLSFPLGAGHTPLDVIDAGLMSLSEDSLNEAGDDMLLFSNFCNHWRQALEEGLFYGEAVKTILSGVAEGLHTESFDAYALKMADYRKLLFFEATIEGYSKRKPEEDPSFDHIAWNAILHGLSTIRMNSLRVFARAMTFIPESCMESVLSGVIANLDAFFNALGRTINPPTITRQSAKMAAALCPLGQAEYRFVLDAITQRLLRHNNNEGVDSRKVCVSWMHLLARLPGVDIDYLSQVCIVMEAESALGRLSDWDVCHLFLAWSNTQAPIENLASLQDTRRKNVLGKNKNNYYAIYGSRLWRTQQYHRARNFCRFLQAIGRERGVVSLAKGVPNVHDTGPCSLANIALGMPRPQVAIDIFCLYEESRKRNVPFWQSKFGFKALETLAWTPDFDYKKLWRILKIQPRRYLWLRSKRKTRHLFPDHASRVATAAVVVGLSPYLSRQMAFAFMTRCYFHLRSRHAKIPPSFVRALIHHITKRPPTDHPVVVSRLRFVLYVIRRELGRAEADFVALEIWRWRTANLGLRQQY